MPHDPTRAQAPASPLPATTPRLRHELAGRPVLWIGAGTSVAAGYPSTGRLVEAMVEAADPADGLDPAWPFPRVADAFVASRHGGALDELLQREIGARPREATAFHLAVARLAGAGAFAAVVTTNYDDLVERTLRDQGVPCVVQSLDLNQTVRGEGEVRVIKLHGSQDDWRRAVLSGRSYDEYERRYAFLSRQLDLLLRRNPVLFAGCSLQDPRILDWLAGLADDEAAGLHPWRALLTEAEWQAATAYTCGKHRDSVQREHRDSMQRRSGFCGIRTLQETASRSRGALLPVLKGC